MKLSEQLKEAKFGYAPEVGNHVSFPFPEEWFKEVQQLEADSGCLNALIEFLYHVGPGVINILEKTPPYYCEGTRISDHATELKLYREAVEAAVKKFTEGRK